MRFVRPAILALIVSACAAAPAAGREIVEAPVKPVAITSFDGSFFVHGTSQDTTQVTQGVSTREKESFLEEGLEFSTRGYVYHPNMAEWQFSASPERTQETMNSDGQPIKTTGQLLNYNFSGLLLKEKPVSAQVFASHAQTRTDRDFAQAVLSTEDRRGGTIYTKGNFPTSFLAETSSGTQTGDLRNVTTDSKHYLATIADRRNENWLTDLTLDRSERTQLSTYTPATGGDTITQNLPDKTDQATLSNNYRFGPGPDKHSLVGQFHVLNETGAYMNKVFSGNESLQLVHSDTLTSFYSASYENNKTVDETDVTRTAEAGLTKQFYDSLQLTGRINGRDETTDTSLDEVWRGSVDATYQKKTLIGTYYSSLNLYREEEHQQSSTGTTLIQRQPLVLPDDFSWVQLSRPNVIGSIIVIDSVTNLPYAEGVQYELRTVGAYTQIRKMPFSPDPIPSGRTILLTYTVESAQDAVIGRQGVTWNNRITLDKVPLSFYVNTQNYDEKLISGDDPGSINPQTGILYGVEWNFQNFQIAAEHENHDQVLSPPWQANRIRVGYHENLSRNVDFAVSAHAEKLQYLQGAQFGLAPGQDFIDTVGANFSLNARLNNYTVLRFTSEAQKSKGQENLTTFRNTVGLVWQYGKMDLALEARYDTMTQDVTSGTATSVMFTLKRKF